MRMRMETVHGTCPVCGSYFIGRTVVKCPKCETYHCLDCWNYKDKVCSIFGCGGTTRAVGRGMLRSINILVPTVRSMVLLSMACFLIFVANFLSTKLTRLAVVETRSFVPKNYKGDTITVDYSMSLDEMTD